MSSDSQSDEDEIRDPDGIEIVNQLFQERSGTVGTISEKILHNEDLMKSQAEQELIVSILERKDGQAHIRSIAKEMRVEPHELTFPLERLSQRGTVTVTGSGIRLFVSLNRETSEE